MCLCTQTLVHAKKQKNNLISQINDIKEFKKLLRTKTNVLVLFVNESKSTQAIGDVFKDTADTMKGKATLVSIDCSNR